MPNGKKRGLHNKFLWQKLCFHVNSNDQFCENVLNFLILSLHLMLAYEEAAGSHNLGLYIDDYCQQTTFNV